MQAVIRANSCILSKSARKKGLRCANLKESWLSLQNVMQGEKGK